MLNKKEKLVMKVIYYEAIKKDGVCLLKPIDMLKTIPYSFEFSNSELTKIVKELELDDYYDFVVTEKRGEEFYCFNLHQKGQAFYREILSEKRAVYRKIYFTVGGVIGAFILKWLIELIAK